MFLFPVLGILLALVGSEFALRFIDYPHKTDQSARSEVYASYGPHYKLAPNLRDVFFSDTSVSSNQYGFRDRFMQQERGPAVETRIAVLGDSWGFGWGLEEGGVPSETAYFAMIFLFGGLGMIIYHLSQRKQRNKEDFLAEEL